MRRKRNWHKKYTKRYVASRRNYSSYIKFFILIIIIFLIYSNWNSISSYLQESREAWIKFYEEKVKEQPERKEECMLAFNELNNLRTKNGKQLMAWDDRLYTLAVFRAKDMWEREYFDHVTPEGKCVKDFQSDFGFATHEIIAENIGGMSYYSKGAVEGDCSEAINTWRHSRGHRYNLYYYEHTVGAIGCYYEICVFLGLHTNPYGLGAGPCTTGAEGEAFWATAPEQEGE